MPTISVNLPDRSYPVRVDANCLGRYADLVQCGDVSSVCVLTHPRLAAYAELVASSFRSCGLPVAIMTIPPGEHRKTLAWAGRIYEGFVGFGLDRRSLVVPVGGGVLGDMGGFAAGTYMRGLAFAQAPTTLLAMVDASVGGKTGVDLPAGKNLVGVFHQPVAVMADVTTLSTLPTRQLRSGLAEVIKHGLIADADYLEETMASTRLILRRDPEALVRTVSGSVEIKAAVVGADERETGRRAILNFGHTIGHALECGTGYSLYSHGEAVAIGMVAASILGELLSVSDSGTTGAVVSALLTAGLPVVPSHALSADEMVEAMGRDKKTVGGSLRFVLCPRIGEAQIVDGVPADAVRETLRRLAAGQFSGGPA